MHLYLAVAAELYSDQGFQFNPHTLTQEPVQVFRNTSFYQKLNSLIFICYGIVHQLLKVDADQNDIECDEDEAETDHLDEEHDEDEGGSDHLVKNATHVSNLQAELAYSATWALEVAI